MAEDRLSPRQDDVVETLDEGDVVRLHDDSGDFIVYTAGDGLSVIKRAPVFDWEYDRLVGLDSDEPAAGYTRLIWPEDIAGIQYRTPLEPQVGDRVLTRWRDGNRSGVHTGFVDEVMGRTYQVHLVAGVDADDLHWDMEIDEEDILDMNSQHRSKYQRCTCLLKPSSHTAGGASRLRAKQSANPLPWQRKPVAGRISSPTEKGFWLVILLIALASAGTVFLL